MMGLLITQVGYNFLLTNNERQIIVGWILSTLLVFNLQTAFAQGRWIVSTGLHFRGSNYSYSSIDSVAFGMNDLGASFSHQFAIGYHRHFAKKMDLRFKLMLYRRDLNFTFYNNRVTYYGQYVTKGLTVRGQVVQPSFDLGMKMRFFDLHAGLALDYNRIAKSDREPFNNRPGSPVGDEQIEVVGNLLPRTVRPWVLHYRAGISRDIGRFALSAEYAHSITDMLREIELNGERAGLRLETVFVFVNLGYYLQKKEKND